MNGNGMLLTLLGLILAVLVQTAIIAYWGGRIARSVAHHEEEIRNLRTRARWAGRTLSTRRPGARSIG